MGPLTSNRSHVSPAGTAGTAGVLRRHVLDDPFVGEAQSRSARSCCDSAGVPGAWGLGVGRCFGKDSGETTKVEA